MTKTLPTYSFFAALPPLRYIGFLLVYLFLQNGYGQVETTYTYDNSLEPDTGFAYDPLIGGTALFGATWGQAGVQVNQSIPLDFTFVFNGAAYTTCKVSSNGFIAFGGTGNLLTGTLLPINSTTTTQYFGAISAFATPSQNRLVHANFGSAPLYTGLPSSIRYETTGSPGSRVFIIQWENAVRWNNNANTPLAGILNFQIRLYEGSNDIEIHFAPTTALPTNASNTGGQCGLRGATNADFNNRRLPTPPNLGFWTQTEPGAGNNNIMNFRDNDTYPNYTFRMRWTAPCFSPGTPAVTFPTASTAVVNWTHAVSIPSGGYDYEVREVGSVPADGPTGLILSGNTSGNALNPLTGLPGGTNMVFWIRSNCGGGKFGGWINSSIFTTTCDPTNVPYFMGFSGAQLPSTMAPCTSQIAVSPSLPWGVSQNQPGMNGRHLQYTQSGTTAANAYFFTQGVNLIAGQAYRISYRYGSQFLTGLSNRMEVRYGTSATVAGMTTQIDVHPDFRGSPFLNTAVFVPTASGVYYFGFRVFSDPGQGNVWLDDILVEESNCTQPQNVTVGTVGSNSAFMSWDAVTPTPAAGYQYFLSTSATPPTPSTSPTATISSNFINLTGLTGGTTYYFWVRSNCSTVERSIWSLVQSFTTTTPLAYCVPVANTAPGSQSFITNVSTTGGITNISNSSTGYATSNGYSDFTQFAVTQVQGGNVNFNVSFTTGGHGVAVWVDWNQNGIFEASERMFVTSAYNFGTSQAGSFTVPAGANLGNTRMRVMVDFWSTAPSTPCAYNLNSGQLRGETEDYTFIVVAAPPALTLNINSSAQCVGTTSPVVSITSPLGDFNTYIWSPSTGVVDLGGGNYQFTSNSTVTYTLTGAQTTAPFSVNTVAFTYNAVALPTPLTITPAAAVVCETGPAVALTASGGIVSGVVALEERFNGGAPDWTFTNTSSGGNPAIPAWTIHNSPYTVSAPTNTWGGAIISSNDNSSFIFTNSDGQGSGSTTNTTMVSPVFSLAGFDNASLSFWHYFRQWTGSFGVVEISTDGGLTWPAAQVLQTYTTTQGTPGGFVNVTLNLNAYLGFSNLRLRFRYFGTWGYGWAVDNVRVEGAAATQVFWSPAAGLFTDAAATIPYNPAVAATTVFALPAANTTYTATVSTPAPFSCTTSQTVEVTRSVVTQGTISASQAICSGLPDPVTLTGHVGTIVRWESALNPAFTVGVTPIANTTATLTGAEMMPITDIKYFRAIVSNGTCEKSTNVISVTYDTDTFNGTSWTSGFGPDGGVRAIFAVSGNHTINSALEACSLEIVSGNITVASGVTLRIENEVVVAPGATLTFQNNASLLQINATQPNSGNIIYRRNSTGMFLFDYTYWSSPVVAQDLFTFSPFTHFMRKYEWNPVTQQWVQLFNVGNHAPLNVYSTPGRGFIVRAPHTGPLVFNSHTSGLPRVVFPGEFVGVPTNGTVTVPTGNTAPGFNLLGNPYPSALDVHAFLIDPANAHLDRTIKYWTHNTPITNNVYNPSDYATYNFTGSNVTDSGTGTAGPNTGVPLQPNLNVPGRFMAAGQGFVIDVLGGNGPGVATFRNSHRVAGNNTMFFRMAQTDAVISAADAIDLQERHRVWLSMSNGQNLQKSLLVGYVEGATNSYDNGYDGKFTASGYGLEFYSLLEAQPLTIQGRALPFAVTDRVPLGYFAQQAGSYTIALAQWDGLFHDQAVYVEDVLTGAIHLLNGGSYTFVTDAGRFDQRFVLRYTNETLSVNTPQFNEHQVVVFKDNRNLVIETQGVAMSQVVLYDMGGRRLASRQGDLGTVVRFDELGIAQQVLLVEITSPEHGKVLKKYVY